MWTLILALQVATASVAAEPPCDARGPWGLYRQDARTARLGPEVATRVATGRWEEWERGILLGGGVLLQVRRYKMDLELHSAKNGVASLVPALLTRAEPTGPFDCRFVHDAGDVRLTFRPSH